MTQRIACISLVSLIFSGLTVAQTAKFAGKISRPHGHARSSVKAKTRGGGTFNDPGNGMVVTTPVSPTALANALLGSGVTLSGTPTLQGNASQAGTFTNAPALVGFSSGIILSSGEAADAASVYAGADLPDTEEDTPGYAPLNALISNQATNDASVLQFSFIPTTSTIYFNYVFASAEYPEFVGSFNDPMALFVNGTAPSNNVAFLPTNPPVAVTINNVNATTNAQFFNKYNGPGDTLPYGGETRVLTATANVNANQVNTITLAVADALDEALDSAVFIQSGSLSTTPTSTPSAVPAPPSLLLAMLGLALLGVVTALGMRRARA